MPVYGYVLIGVAALVLLLVAVVAMRPAAFKVERSAVVAAPPADAFAVVNDFRQWDDWSPWAEIDPTMTKEYAGPAAGVGAVYSWAGKKVGAGRMTLTESVPGESVRINLEFFRPMKATNLTVFAFTPDAGGTRVTWTMTGRNGFTGKLFWMLLNLDKLIGKDFEKGLASMKGVVEGQPAAA